MYNYIHCHTCGETIDMLYVYFCDACPYGLLHYNHYGLFVMNSIMILKFFSFLMPNFWQVTVISKFKIFDRHFV